jgi:hypothetical protein
MAAIRLGLIAAKARNEYPPPGRFEAAEKATNEKNKRSKSREPEAKTKKQRAKNKGRDSPAKPSPLPLIPLPPARATINALISLGKVEWIRILRRG